MAHNHSGNCPEEKYKIIQVSSSYVNKAYYNFITTFNNNNNNNNTCKNKNNKNKNNDNNDFIKSISTRWLFIHQYLTTVNYNESEE